MKFQLQLSLIIILIILAHCYNNKIISFPDNVNEYRFKFDALRSKCRITKQPDTGTFYLYYKSKKHIKEDSLVRYFSSFYEENHEIDLF